MLKTKKFEWMSRIEATKKLMHDKFRDCETIMNLMCNCIGLYIQHQTTKVMTDSNSQVIYKGCIINWAPKE